MGFEGCTEKMRGLSHEVTGAYVEVEEESQPLRHFKWIIILGEHETWKKYLHRLKEETD